MALTSDTKFVEAIEAMKGLGIPEDTTKHVLKNLCKLYGKKWRFIEAENYQILADAIFQYQDDQVDEVKKRKDTQRSGDVEPQSKRLNLMQHEDRTDGCSQSVFRSKLNERNFAPTFARGNIDEQMPSLMVVPEFNLDIERPPHDLEDIAKGEEKVKILAVNEINDMHPPLFHYIAQNNVYQEANVNFSLARIGDEDSCSNCFGDCLSSPILCACTRETGGEFAYSLDGNLKEGVLNEYMTMKVNPPYDRLYFCEEDCPLVRSKNNNEKCKGHLVRKFIKECWIKCGCNKKCGNRVVQRGITQDLQVFLTTEGKGWGLRTVKSLPKGAFVCEYVGEILTNIELFQRNEKRTGNEKHAYPMLLDADWSSESILNDEEALCLDATTYGNVARFINHRCYDANLVDIPVEIETPDHHYYHAAFFTSRAVDAMEELTWDYGIDFNDENHPVKAFRCQCGSNLCRGIPLANGDSILQDADMQWVSPDVVKT